MKKIYFIFMLIAATSTFISCKKAEDGKDGKDGAIGPQGPAGNANVISKTFTLNNWYEQGSDYYSYDYETEVSWSEITQDIKDKGIVMAYLSDGTDWYALPYTESDATTVNSFNFSLQVGKIYFLASGTDLTNTPEIPEPSAFNGLNVRVVAVPSTTATARINWKNYNEVKQAFNLQ